MARMQRPYTTILAFPSKIRKLRMTLRVSLSDARLLRTACSFPSRGTRVSDGARTRKERCPDASAFFRQRRTLEIGLPFSAYAITPSVQNEMPQAEMLEHGHETTKCSRAVASCYRSDLRSSVGFQAARRSTYIHFMVERMAFWFHYSLANMRLSMTLSTTNAAARRVPCESLQTQSRRL